LIDTIGIVPLINQLKIKPFFSASAFLKLFTAVFRAYFVAMAKMAKFCVFF
jgi:hypothetical protein